jgi:hypothetical protein
MMDGLIAITQVAPLGRQEVRDHNRLAVAFGLRCWPVGCLSPHDLAVVVLVESGFIVGDEDKSKWEAIGHWESVRAWEFTSIVVPLMEAQVVSLPPFNKCTSIGHDILPLMAIDVHPVLSGLVSPVKFLQPVGCCTLRNRWLANAFLREYFLHLRACNKIDNILCLHKPLLGLFDHPQLDLARYVLIFQGCPPRLAQAMERECFGLQELQSSLADASCMSIPMSLSLRDN